MKVVDHFHGSVYTGMFGGAVEVFVRSEGWEAMEDAPRPIPCAGIPLPNGIEQSEFMAIVPLMGTELAAAVECRSNPWWDYIAGIVRIQQESPTRVGIFPYLLDRGATDQTELGALFGKYQHIAYPPSEERRETEIAFLCRDLAQGTVQLLSEDENSRLTVFVSHTKRSGSDGEYTVSSLITTVREVIASTHLREFFDTSDLQPGRNWDAELRNKAGRSALLAVRTDQYSSREWCQREISIAKREGMPVVILNALEEGERRGSFLMDHIPRVPIRMEAGSWRREDIYRALNLLVDECLKRTLWMHQEALSRDGQEIEIAWWSPHALEPLTLIQWLEAAKKAGTLPGAGALVRVLHPDPPLGSEEKLVLEQLISLSHADYELDIMTPRLLAARGG